MQKDESRNRQGREYGDSVLFSGWLQDLHREDIRYFDPGDFTRSDLFKAIKSGMPAFEIGIQRVNGYDPASIAEMLSFYNETFYATIVRQRLEQKARWMLRNAADIADLKELQQYTNEICSAALNRTSALAAAKDLSGTFLQDLEDRRNSKVIRWGLPGLDAMTGGIRRKELTTIAARPGGGKSAFALRVADQAQRWGEKVLFFPLEMSTNENLARLLMMNDLVSERDLKSGRLTEEQSEQVKSFLEDIEARKKLLIYEGVRDLESIDALVAEHEPYLVIIDQLTQLRASGQRFDSMVYQYTYMTAALKAMALNRNVAVLLLAQVSRAGSSQPSLSELKWSGSIEEDSDSVLILHRIPKSQYEGPLRLNSDEQALRLKLEKQRSGNTGEMDIVFKPSKLKFYQQTY